MSITTSEGCPYKISIVGVGPIDIIQRVIHKINYQSRSTINIGGLSTVKNKYLCLEMVFLIHDLGECEGVGEDSGHGLVI